MANPEGRPPLDLVRDAWADRFGLSFKVKVTLLTTPMCWQLARCRDDMARRLLLGLSK